MEEVDALLGRENILKIKKGVFIEIINVIYPLQGSIGFGSPCSGWLYLQTLTKGMLLSVR